MGIFNFKRRKKKNVIEYIPDVGFIFNSIPLEWKTSRLEVRKKLKVNFREDDRTIDVAQFFDGDKSKDIHQKRDIYKDVASENDLIFLNYDSENKLIELAVHYGYEIKIKDTLIDFKTDLTDIIKEFQELGIKCIELEKGNFLLPTLKITIADNESIGGDGKKLSYFYCSSDITHLME